MVDDDKGETKTVFGVPVAAFVRGGGTRSSGHDKMIAERELDATKRRAVADKENLAARTPIQEGGAILHQNTLASKEALESGAEPAVVLLKYLTPSGDEFWTNGNRIQCLADVIMLEPDNLQLIIVCPRCKEQNVPQGQCQIAIQQRNRRWELDMRTAGELIMFEEKPYRSAGMVVESERFCCPNCGWAARIVMNTVRPD